MRGDITPRHTPPGPGTVLEEETGSAAEAEESSDTDSDVHSDYHPSSSDESSVEENDNVAGEPRYPQRDRRQRVIPGTVSWDNVEM